MTKHNATSLSSHTIDYSNAKEIYIKLFLKIGWQLTYKKNTIISYASISFVFFHFHFLLISLFLFDKVVLLLLFNPLSISKSKTETVKAQASLTEIGLDMSGTNTALKPICLSTFMLLDLFPKKWNQKGWIFSDNLPKKLQVESYVHWDHTVVFFGSCTIALTFSSCALK